MCVHVRVRSDSSAFLVWCFAPQTLGASRIYAMVIEPVLLRYEGQIDSAGSKAGASIRRVAADVQHEVSDEVSVAKNRMIDSAIANAMSSGKNAQAAAPAQASVKATPPASAHHDDIASAEPARKEE